MNKLYKILLTVGGVIGGILLMFNKKNLKYQKDLKINKSKIKEVQEKSTKLQGDKKNTKLKIKKTSKVISSTKEKLKSTKSSKKTISEFKKKYRK